MDLLLMQLPILGYQPQLPQTSCLPPPKPTMSPITQCVNYNSNSNFSNMFISPSPLVVYQARCTPTPNLEYAEEISPLILFSTAEHIQPINLQPLKLEDDEGLDKDSISKRSICFFPLNLA